MESIMKLESPSCWFISGPTGSGKSYFLSQLIRHRQKMFKHPPVAFHYAYKVYQPELFGEMQARDGVKFHEGLPTREQLIQWSRDANGRHIGVILDDMQHSVCSSQTVAEAFGVLSHHLGISLFVISQNLFPRAKYSRDIVLNSHYVVLFLSKRDRLMVMTLARQLCAGQSAYFMSAYDSAMNERKFPYLLIDLHPCTERKYFLRTSLFPGEMTVVYLPK